jgi:Ser/Thr protein kinase RdoA (MazF antagonist)
LAHLRRSGIDFVPEPLGYDDQRREVLSFVDGDAPTEPLPPWATTDDVLVHLARLLRRLHDASDGWQPPTDAVWGHLPGAEDVATEPLFEVPELVSHRDYCPGNVIFRGNLPAALIDFDLAQPTTRVADIVVALYWWAPLLHPDDRAPHLRGADIPRRVRLFADAYGMTREQRAEVAPIAVRRARNVHRTAKHAATVDPVFRRWWDEGVRERMPRAEAWIAENADEITAAT